MVIHEVPAKLRGNVNQTILSLRNGPVNMGPGRKRYVVAAAWN
jgi:hypothetical protein